jgi:uncharacterized protein (TIGR02588 family)
MKWPEKNWLEWGVFALSLLFVLTTAGLLIHEHVSLGHQPADPQIMLGPPEAHAGYFAVPVKVVNRGDNTAESVQIEVELRLDGGASEKAQVELQYLPRRATRHAWVTFRHDPRKGKLQSRVLGYQKP